MSLFFFGARSFRPYCVEENVLSVVTLCPWVIRDLFHIKGLFGHLHEPQVGTSAALEAEVAHRVGTKEVLERGDQERECWFKVDAVGSENNVGF